MPDLKPKIPADYSVPSLSQVTVAAGGTARFRCKVQRADSTFRWRKNGVLISVDQSERLEIRVRTRKGKSVGALIIRKASDSDSGCYSCETNGANQTLNRTSWRLDVTEGLCLSVQYCLYVAGICTTVYMDLRLCCFTVYSCMTPCIGIKSINILNSGHLF